MCNEAGDGASAGGQDGHPQEHEADRSPLLCRLASRKQNWEVEDGAKINREVFTQQRSRQAHVFIGPNWDFNAKTTGLLIYLRINKIKYYETCSKHQAGNRVREQFQAFLQLIKLLYI